VRFGWCRAYLLAAVLAAGIIPLLHIPVWPGEIITIDAAASTGGGAAAGAVADPAPAYAGERFWLLLHGLGTALIAALTGGQIVRIRRLRRRASVVRSDRHTIVCTQEPIAAFSFLRSIYLWQGTPEAERRIIIAHEASHIARRHSYERIVMELLKAIWWWNPFVWIAARRLTEVEEFEADSDVLDSGCDVSEYMQTLLKQLLGYRPDIANGLRNSLIKKRFQMMTRKPNGSHALLRLAATLPIFLGLACVFSLTTRAAEIRIEQPAAAIPDGDDTPYLTTEVMPRFRNGGIDEFRAWMSEQIVYPAEAIEKNLSGNVIVSFVVERDGSVGEIEVIQSPAEALSAEIRRVIAASPQWTPGKNDGKTVRVKFTLPIHFKMPPTAGKAAADGAGAQSR